MSKINWPSREEWAKIQTTAYFDESPDVPRGVSLYATPEEIAAVVAALKRRWAELGREMKTLKPSLADVLQCLGETNMAYNKRWLAMDEKNRDRAGSYWELRNRHHAIKVAIKELEQGFVPRWHEEGDGLLLEPLLGRVRKAEVEADAEFIRQKALTPVDDAAWDKELRQREKYEESCLPQNCNRRY